MEEGEDQGAAWYVFILFNRIITLKIQKNNKVNETDLSGADTNTQQKTTTHKTHVGKS